MYLSFFISFSSLFRFSHTSDSLLIRLYLARERKRNETYTKEKRKRSEEKAYFID